MSLQGGTAEICDCLFEESTVPIIAIYIDSLIVMNSILKNNGLYIGPIIGYSFQGMEIVDSNDILLVGNSFSGFSPRGLLYIRQCSNVALTNNTFNINTTQLYYNISSNNIYFEPPYSPVTIAWSENTNIIRNLFDDNKIDSTVPWILYYENDEINCLSSN
eukprot:399664_1